LDFRTTSTACFLLLSTGCHAWWAEHNPVNGGQQDANDIGCLPEDFIEDDEALADDPPAPDPVADLAGTQWQGAIEGCAPYATTYTFASVDLAVTEEDMWDGGEVYSRAEGAWAPYSHGVVDLAWQVESEWDDTVVHHSRRWTYAPMSDALASRIHDSWYLEPGTPWSDTALLATNGSATRFHGEYASSYVSGDTTSESRTVINVRFGEPLRAGTATTAIVELIVANGEVSDILMLDAVVSADADTGLNRVQLGDFTGTTWEITTAWYEFNETRVSEEGRWDINSAFVPELWFDPNHPEVVAFAAGRMPLLNKLSDGTWDE